MVANSKFSLLVPYFGFIDCFITMGFSDDGILYGRTK